MIKALNFGLPVLILGLICCLRSIGPAEAAEAFLHQHQAVCSSVANDSAQQSEVGNNEDKVFNNVDNVDNVDNEDDLDYLDDDLEEETIPDPLAPFNRAMYHFNDKLYFWLLKPVSRAYRAVFPEPVRVSVGNFFSNLLFPQRFVNCVLQTNFKGAGTELSRFALNTTIGIGGLFDPATRHFGLKKQEEDFGQTFGSYGIGDGFFINWPILGPSTLRDSVGMIGDYFLDPVSYVKPPEASLGVYSYESVNNTSLKIGDYEALKGAAIDPYIAIRNAYIQHRQKR